MSIVFVYRNKITFMIVFIFVELEINILINAFNIVWHIKWGKGNDIYYLTMT